MQILSNINNDTICALATQSGGAIGIVRISGDDAINITDKIFNKNIIDAKPNTMHYGQIIEISQKRKEIIDDVIVSVYRSPHSYTGENAVEISCHGSSYIINKIIELLINNGCRMAQAGEYTQRAFMNGKMDLSQAEAVADLIASTNRATHKMAISQLRGNFSSKLKLLRQQLLHLTSLMELELDFSDHEDIEFADRTELLSLTRTIEQHISCLSNTFITGQALKQGIPVVIVGQTNVGKSTLLNRLLHDNRAIVSDIHGTTRDTIEDTINIKGICFRFIDTAGLRYTEDSIEQLGIERTYKKIEEASIIIWVTEQKPTNREINEMKELTYGKNIIIVQNKSDLKPNTTNTAWTCPMLFISAKENIGIDELEQEIYKAANIPEFSENDVIITNARHYEALTKAHKDITRVLNSLQSGTPSDLIAEDLHLVLSDLAEITGGEITTKETLSNIFQHFCVGK